MPDFHTSWQDTPIFIKTYELYKKFYEYLPSFPRKDRYTLEQKCEAVLLESFQNFLNSLATPLQILIRVREVDVDNYLEQIAKRKSAEKEAVYREQIDNYSDFIKQVVSGNKILTRRFYIVVPYDNQSKDKDFSIISEQMNLQKDLVMRAIEKLGMKARAVDSFELLNLFYTFYNPNQVKTQELTRESIGALLEGLYA